MTIPVSSIVRPLSVIEARVLRVAIAHPGASAVLVNEGRARPVTGRQGPAETRWITSNQRAATVFFLRGRGYLEPNNDERPGMYPTDAGRRALAELAAVKP